MHSYLLIVLLNRCIQWGSVSVHTSPIDITGTVLPVSLHYTSQYMSELSELSEHTVLCCTSYNGSTKSAGS